MMDPHRRCAWCQRDLGPAGPGFTHDTHGICESCAAEFFPGCAWCGLGDGICHRHAAELLAEATEAPPLPLDFVH